MKHFCAVAAIQRDSYITEPALCIVWFMQLVKKCHCADSSGDWGRGNPFLVAGASAQKKKHLSLKYMNMVGILKKHVSKVLLLCNDCINLYCSLLIWAHFHVAQAPLTRDIQRNENISMDKTIYSINDGMWNVVHSTSEPSKGSFGEKLHEEALSGLSARPV